jgi:hypothetical protein
MLSREHWRPSERTIVPRAPWRSPRIERLRDLPKRPCARFLGLSDNGEHVGCVSVSLSLDGRHRVLAGHLELWVAECHPSGVRRRKRLTRARGYECALLLGQSGEQVQDERVNIRPKLSDQEGHFVGHEPRDEVHSVSCRLRFQKHTNAA